MKIGALIVTTGLSRISGVAALLSEVGAITAGQRMISAFQCAGVSLVGLVVGPEDKKSERQLAQNTELAYSGSTAAPEDYSRRSETVLVDGTEGDGTVVVRTVYPTYRGALVVCQGGDRPEVKLAVTEAVAALTGLSADRVTVAKWQ